MRKAGIDHVIQCILYMYCMGSFNFRFTLVDRLSFFSGHWCSVLVGWRPRERGQNHISAQVRINNISKKKIY